MGAGRLGGVKIGIAERVYCFKIVGFYASGFWGGKAVGQRTVIGDDEQPLRVQVEPPDGKKHHFGKRRRQQFHNGAVHGVGSRGNDSRRFIEHQVTAGAEVQCFSIADEHITFGV